MLGQLDLILLKLCLQVDMLLADAVEWWDWLFLCCEAGFWWVNCKYYVVEAGLAHTCYDSVLKLCFSDVDIDSFLNDFHPAQMVATKVHLIDSVNQLKLTIDDQEHPNVIVKSYKQRIILWRCIFLILSLTRNNNQLLRRLCPRPNPLKISPKQVQLYKILTNNKRLKPRTTIKLEL